MKHTYLTQENIQASLSEGAITYKEANELTMKLERCAKRVIKDEPISFGIVTLHKVA